MSHVLLFALSLQVVFYPNTVWAKTRAALTDTFKSMFATEKVVDEGTMTTSQSIALFKPVLIEASSSSGDQNPEQDSLHAVSGSLRVSTEDVDFPMSDTVSVYEVKKGDTIQDVAKLFDVSVNTIMWANNLSSKTITKGDTLLILPITGIKHTVKKGDTINSIAKKYKADIQDVASYNGLIANAALSIGDTVIVPDGEVEITQTIKPKATTKKPRVLNSYSLNAPSGFLFRPISGGRKTQGIHGHNGVDLASYIGTPVMAAASGKVIVAKASGYNGGYGIMIIISHDKGIQTIYAHLQDVYVTQGETVAQGQSIGSLGNTGKSTGPHLHFEVRGAKNPF